MTEEHKKNQTCLRDLPVCDGNCTQIHQKQLSVKWSSLEKNQWKIWQKPFVTSGVSPLLQCFICTPRGRKKKSCCLKAAALLSGPNSRNLGTSPWWIFPGGGATNLKNMLVKLDVSLNGGFSQILHFNRVFRFPLFSPSILGYHNFRKHPYESNWIISPGKWDDFFLMETTTQFFWSHLWQKHTQNMAEP